jgi:hypothetical protein
LVYCKNWSDIWLTLPEPTSSDNWVVGALTQANSYQRRASIAPKHQGRSPLNKPPPGLSLQLDTEVLEPVIRKIVAEVLAATEEKNARLGDRLAYSEQEAARLLGLNPHQLRDERLRGRIAASTIVGRRVRYTRDDLLQYLAASRTNH